MTRLALGYAIGFAIFLLLADFGALRPLGEFVNAYLYLDKLVHFLIYGCLALVVNAALITRPRKLFTRAIVISSILVLIAATLEEYSNVFVARRTWSLGDLAANYLGIFCVGILPLAYSTPQRTTSSAG